MTQPELTELMKQMVDAMEHNPDGWWKEFYCEDKFEPQISVMSPQGLFNALAEGAMVYKKPRTYTLHIEDMPEPLREPPEEKGFYWAISWNNDAAQCTTWVGDNCDRERLRAGLCYPDRDSGTLALQKLKQAMGGEA